MAAFGWISVDDGIAKVGDWSFEAKMFSILLTIVLAGGGWAFTQVWSKLDDTHDAVNRMQEEVKEVPSINARLSALELHNASTDGQIEDLRRDADALKRERDNEKINSIDRKYEHEKAEALAVRHQLHRERGHFDRTQAAEAAALKHDGAIDP